MNINLMGNTTFTEAQLARCENRLVASGLPAGEELKMNRGYVIRDSGVPPVMPPGLAGRSEMYISQLEAVSANMDQIRLDNALLIGTINYEKALTRLEYPIKEPPEYPAEVPGYDNTGDPIMVTNPEIVKDQAERANAQAVIDDVSAEELALYNLRNPIEE